jgi:pimeloyl-ACP methyl ester carboxylesterase
MWDPVVAELKDRYRCFAIDTRGVGQSTAAADESQYSFEQYASDANQVLDAHGVDRCHVWSMAWGSRAALAYCALNADRVISAALYDASIGRADVKAQREGSRRAVQKQEAAGIPRMSPPEGWNVHAQPDEVVNQAMMAAGKFDLPGNVKNLTMPLLIATGDHDPNLTSSRELVDIAPDARLVVMENVGHGSVIQRPDYALEVFLEFQVHVR